MKFVVLSDTHYISEKMLLGDNQHEWVLKNRMNRAVFRDLKERTDIDTVLITGDLTNCGDVYSHDEYRELLQELKDAGKKVYVLTATHDFYFNRSCCVKLGWNVRYKAEPWANSWFDKDNTDYKSIVTDEYKNLSEEECVPPFVDVQSPERLWDFYRDFGPNQAFSVCDRSYSYCVKLDEKLWCLMLNNNLREYEASKSISPSYSPDCYRWMEGLVKKAKEEGAFLFACTHHPMVPPNAGYRMGASDKEMRANFACHAFADMGINLVFTGHTHFSDIAFGSSDKGNTLCDITTPSLTHLPPMYREAELSPGSTVVKVKSIEVPNEPYFEIEEPTLREHFEKKFVEEYTEKVKKMKAPVGDLLLSLTVGKLSPICKTVCHMSDSEVNAIADRKIFDIVMELGINLQGGDGKYTPDTPEYKLMMGLANFGDSVIDTQPFTDIRKSMKGYTLSFAMQELLFNNYVGDGNAEFDFMKLPEEKYEAYGYKSIAGEVMMGILSAVGVLMAPLAPVVSSVALPVMTYLKKKKFLKDPPKPQRY